MQVYHYQRGGRVGLFCLKACRGGISRFRRDAAVGGIHCQTAAGSLGGAGKDRPKIHRRRTVSARHEARPHERGARRSR